MPISNILERLNHRHTKLFPKLSKTSKFIFSFLLIVSLAFFASRILAVDNLIKDTQDAQEAKNNSESWQENAWNTTAVNALTTLTGKINFDSNGNITSFNSGGMVETTNKMVASVYSQPQASGIEYIAQVKNNFLGKQTYAQGVNIGNNGKSLQPLLPAWKGFRNIVYALFSIVFVIIGIMIMLRIKISPQAVITIQAAIPKLVTALIMVTFSYAIAGLLIDLSYIIQGLVISLFFQIKGVSLTDGLFSNTRWTLNGIGTNFLQLNNANYDRFGSLMQGAVPYVSTIRLSATLGGIAFGSFVGAAASTLTLGIAGNGIANTIFKGIGEAVGIAVGGVGGIIVLILIGLLIAIWMIKLWFGLLKTYVLILIQIITAPFIIGMGAFPNSKVGFSSWLLQLIARIAVFPVTLITIISICYLIDLTDSCSLWAPVLLDIDLGVCTGGMLGAAIGLAGLSMLAKLPNLVPEAIFKLKPGGFGSAIGEGFKPASKTGTGLGKAAASGVGGYMAGTYYTGEDPNTHEQVQYGKKSAKVVGGILQRLGK